jgi:hypothetical protein
LGVHVAAVQTPGVHVAAVHTPCDHVPKPQVPPFFWQLFCDAYCDLEQALLPVQVLWVVAATREVKPPFSPEAVIDDFSILLKTYKIGSVTGDRYAGEFPRELFRKRGISYECSEKPKSDLFRDLLPLLNSGRVVLPKSERLVSQLCQLERRVARSGKDSITHPDGQHDDVANAVAGAASLSKAGTYGWTDEAIGIPPPSEQRFGRLAHNPWAGMHFFDH